MPPESEVYDGIILGTGHNSLILQAYCCRAGLKVLSIDQRDVAGGGLSTMEYPHGSRFLHNTHSFYHRALTFMPWYQDLELAHYGARYLEPELNVALITTEGQCLQWWTDSARTEDSFAQFSRRDARRLREWRNRFLPVVEKVLIPEATSPPLPPNQRRKELERTSEGRLLLQISPLSPLEFVQREFEHPVVQAGLLFFNGLREVDLRSKGFGHHIPALLASRGKAQFCRGGSFELAKALLKVVEEAGGHVLLNTFPDRILVEQDKACGVLTRTGEVLRARLFVASGLNPQQTFLDLLSDEDIDSTLREKAARFRFNLVAPLFSLHLNLRTPPRYLASEDYPELNQAFMVILGLSKPEQFLDLVAAHDRGDLPPPILWGSCPTQFDPSQAPDGAHTAFMWEKAPFDLHGDSRNWRSARESHARALLDFWGTFAPGIHENILDAFSQTPAEIEQTLPNMRQADLLVGALDEEQSGYHRPFPGAGNYRQGLSGLYLCGSSCHPGGNITGLPGYNCAQVLLKDLGIEAEWFPTV